jgi:hypothetical protein
MRNLLAFLAALALTVAGVGWYLDWYRVRSSPAEAGQRSVTVDIDVKKIGSDLIEAEHKVQEKLAEKSKAHSVGVPGPKVEKGPAEPPVPPANVGAGPQE